MTAVALIPCIAAVGGTFEFIRVASANLREKDDSWNPAIAGFFAGGILGLRRESYDPSLMEAFINQLQIGHFPLFSDLVLA